MRQLFFALAFVLTACATPPASADPIAADPQLAQTCVARADNDYAALERCNGIVANACIEAEGPSTMALTLCWSAEYDVWRQMIETSTARIESDDAEKGVRLRRANEAWQAWLDAECDYFSYEFGGGSGEQVERAQCGVVLAHRRAIDLLAPFN